jgi:hypothetical protein
VEHEFSSNYEEQGIKSLMQSDSTLKQTEGLKDLLSTIIANGIVA